MVFSNRCCNLISLNKKSRKFRYFYSVSDWYSSATSWYAAKCLSPKTTTEFKGRRACLEGKKGDVKKICTRINFNFLSVILYSRYKNNVRLTDFMGSNSILSILVPFVLPKSVTKTFLLSSTRSIACRPLTVGRGTTISAGSTRPSS